MKFLSPIFSWLRSIAVGRGEVSKILFLAPDQVTQGDQAVWEHQLPLSIRGLGSVSLYQHSSPDSCPGIFLEKGLTKGPKHH